MRVALGARSRDIVALVVRQGLRPVAVGVLAGAIGAFGITRFIESMLFGVTPADPLTFLLCALLLGTAALVACWIPARRAATVDPITVLRSE